VKDVVYKKDGKIAYITLSRPDKLNSISADMVNYLPEIWQDFRDDDSLWVAIISGEGRAFCAGGVVENLPTGKWTISQSIALGDRVIGPRRHEIWKPIIAALHGYVFGAGFWLAMECDLRVAANNTLFSLPEPRVGFPTTFTAFVPRFIPEGIAAEMLYVAERIDAKRAHDIGFINKVVPLSDLMKEATALAERVCENAPLAVQAMKKVMRRYADVDSQNLLKISEDAFRSVYESEDMVEGKEAFKEKRKPEWKGK
jgi:enoyl-CoA hydratase/carnithine racemase